MWVSVLRMLSLARPLAILSIHLNVLEIEVIVIPPPPTHHKRIHAHTYTHTFYPHHKIGDRGEAGMEGGIFVAVRTYLLHMIDTFIYLLFPTLFLSPLPLQSLTHTTNEKMLNQSLIVLFVISS